MEFNRKTLDLLEEENIAAWGEYADKIWSTDSEFAEQIYQKILSVDGEHTTALSNYADFLQNLGRFREAKLIYSRLLQLENDNPNLYFRFGVFCVDIGELDAAEKHLLHFLEKESLAAERLMDKSNELAEQEKFRSAEWLYRFMMKQIPEDPFIFNNYALLLADLGRYSEAEEFFQKALKEEKVLGTDLSVAFNYANLLFLMDRIEEAEWYYNKALLKDPKDIPVLNNYVSLLIRKGEFEKAENVLSKILSINPSDITALQNYSNLLVRDGRYQEAIHNARSLVDTYPEYSYAYFQLASVLIESDALEEAVEILYKARELESDSIEIIALLAVTLADLNKYDQSEEIFQQALIVHSGDPMLRYHYAAMLFDCGRYEDAQRWLALIIESDPSHGEALGLLGNIAQVQGRVYEARTLFERSVEKDPDNPETWFQAALFFHSIRDYVASENAFSKALFLSPGDKRIISEKKRCEKEKKAKQ
ncbi:MAG: tetratricopeptide repeat protein [Brevinemataceae bacterium]